MTARNVPSMNLGVETIETDSVEIMSQKNKSILTTDKLDRCYLCGAYGLMDEHHIFGGPCRKVSDRLGLVVHLCRPCHKKVHESDHELMEYLHMEGQGYYEEKIGTREEFIRDFIRSYL